MPFPRPQIHFLHVIPVPMPAVVGGLGGLDTGLVTVNPDPQEDVKHIAEAKDFINRRFATKVATKNVPYKVEIVHFLTDNDSIGEAIVKRAEVLKAAVVIMAKHQRNALTEFFLGSVTKVSISGMERGRKGGCDCSGWAWSSIDVCRSSLFSPPVSSSLFRAVRDAPPGAAADHSALDTGAQARSSAKDLFSTMGLS